MSLIADLSEEALYDPTVFAALGKYRAGGYSEYDVLLALVKVLTKEKKQRDDLLTQWMEVAGDVKELTK